MSLPNYLAKIKSAGIYRFVWDKSIIPPTSAETLRLVVGYSEKGPFNTPVYVDKVSDFYTIFGNVNKKLERKGIYFHRMAIQALAAGPILALNLKPFTDHDSAKNIEDIEQIQYLSINPSNILRHKMNIPKETPLVDVYNTNRFWYLDADQLPEKINHTKYMTIAHTDTKDRSCSIIMRPSNPVGYNVTIREWYKNVIEEEMPIYLEPIQHELVSKYFADIYVFRGEFTPELVREGGSFGNYMTEFSSEGVVTGQKWNGYFNINYQGSKDANMLYTNPPLNGFDGEDVNGEKKIVWENIANTEAVFPAGAINRYGEIISSDTPAYEWSAKTTKNESGYSLTKTANSLAIVEDLNNLIPTLTVNNDIEQSVEEYKLIAISTFDSKSVNSLEESIADKQCYLWKEVNNNKYVATLTIDTTKCAIVDITSVEDTITTSSSSWALCESNVNDILNYWVSCENNYTLGSPLISINTDYQDAYGEKIDALAALASDSTSNFIQSYRGCLLPYFKDSMGNYISLDIVFNLDHDSHNMLMKLDETVLDDILSQNNDKTVKEEIEKVLYCQDVYKETFIYEDVENLTINDKENWGKEYDSIPDLSGMSYDELMKALSDPEYNKIKVNDICYQLVHKVPEYGVLGQQPEKIYLTPVYIKGYTYKTITDDNGIKLQNKILSVLEDKGIRTALTNRVDVDYHYIVDTFKSYIFSNCKSKISMIAKEKDNAFALLNFPPIADFISSNKFKTNKKFDISKLAAARYGFSLPSESEGASHCAFFTNVAFSDGTLKSIVPSAAIVSNNFIKKYDGSLKPYSIIAGPNRGVVAYSGMIGPDYNYGRSDLDVLEPMGVNAIIYVPRKGVYINSNQTAKQSPVSALSKIHIRELVIYIQDEIENMLQNYQWELNTQTLRDTIKTSADYMLSKIMADGGIYAFSTVCDSTNNTPEIIDNEMLVLDIAIEPARGAGKMVQQLTIHKTGGITSTAN